MFCDGLFSVLFHFCEGGQDPEGGQQVSGLKAYSYTAGKRE